ncbi:helix-turn-helix domain-containing protein [Paenibacillus sp. GCM10023252]|uniref:AraC family transcriptional regulator n=1 Tax=Paenibacillus sp. GCM10023252 TaxID=3252649 RepID=UPI003618D480
MPSSAYPLFQSSFILQASSKTHHWSGDGPLSIKTFKGGRAYYQTNRGHYVIEQDSYLLLNEGEHYTIAIDSDTRVDSFCLFFRRGLAPELLTDLSRGLADGLNDPWQDGISSPVPPFHAKTYQHSDLILSFMNRMQQQLPVMGQDPLWMEEQFHEALQTLLCVHRLMPMEMESLAAARLTTREELFRRTAIAREYLHAYYDRSLPLEEVSRVACLSVNHLIRSFKQLFGVSPHQYVSARRMTEAQRLLQHTEESITEIALRVGFDNPSSFHKLFKLRTGLAPRSYRAAARRN